MKLNDFKEFIYSSDNFHINIDTAVRILEKYGINKKFYFQARTRTGF